MMMSIQQKQRGSSPIFDRIFIQRLSRTLLQKRKKYSS